ncbi:MAG TPA: DNA-formamidopyrimidine glycosylase family protein [Ideonella sp.]|uniref:Fpg/Nei family DNA glycosylase n=1 Tax=Ideonella sp. TaxID=1929293 RepID=UPI002E347BD6|nr:DNA-formamidopyrimidine glycosylase family protein [Ideonella sp.]HEX5687642.1 DNA-formamidopyrimidine glycosylase family protein [Ideonella sp.]
MPELPDVSVYAESLAAKLGGGVLRRIRIANPFLLRTAVPPINAAEGRSVHGVERLGKRVVIVLQGDVPDEPSQDWFLVLHLMIAGRLHWYPAGAKPPAKGALAFFEFDAGTLVFTEAGTQRRASLHLVVGREALAAMDPGGLEVLQASQAEFDARLLAGKHTLKRALTAPQAFSGIGNSYSDEILHRARLSPVTLTTALGADERARLFNATREVLTEWTERLRDEAARSGGWPKSVTAFRSEMAVHGRFGQPCPVCGAPVQRIVYASNETNYCARCQTGGKLLADRALSRLLKASWPKTLDG